MKGPLLIVPDENLMSSRQLLQESPLELELDEMMGKPVHTLSVDDDNETSDSTVLGPKLTDNQINRLGDIFEDRRASSFLFLSHCTGADQAGFIILALCHRVKCSHILHLHPICEHAYMYGSRRCI